MVVQEGRLLAFHWPVMLRSEFMTLCQIVDQTESARSFVNELGELGLVEIKDLNNDLAVYKRTFSDDVRKCDDLLRKLTFINQQLQKSGLTLTMTDPSDMMRACGML